jgi:hypothetical protein
MVAFYTQNHVRPSKPAWQDLFVSLLPAIRNHARFAFRRLSPELREECIQETVCNACSAVARLAELGKLDLAYGGPLAVFAVAQVREGRKVGGHLNCCDVMSPYCQRRKNIAVERLDHFDHEENAWQEAVIQDTRSTPVPDIVSFRIDFDEWLGRMSQQKRRLAKVLALGHRTNEVAKRFQLSAGRVAQLRKEFAESWEIFQREAADAQAVA